MKFSLTILSCAALLVCTPATAGESTTTAEATQGRLIVTPATAQTIAVIDETVSNSGDPTAFALLTAVDGLSLARAGWGSGSLLVSVGQQAAGAPTTFHGASASFTDTLVLGGVGPTVSLTNSYAIDGRHTAGRGYTSVGYSVTAPLGTLDRDSFKIGVYNSPDQQVFQGAVPCTDDGIAETCHAFSFLNLQDVLGIGDFVWNPMVEVTLPVGLELFIETVFYAQVQSVTSTFSQLDMRNTYLFEGMSGFGLEEVVSARFGALPTREGRFGYQAAFDALDAVPEPQTWAMMILGFLGVGTMARRQRSAEQPLRT